MKSHSKSICAQYPIQSNQKNWNEVVEYILFALVLYGFKVVVHKIVWNVENCAINELLSNVDHYFVSKLMVFAVEYPHMFRLLVISTNEKKTRITTFDFEAQWKLENTSVLENHQTAEMMCSRWFHVIWTVSDSVWCLHNAYCVLFVGCQSQRATGCQNWTLEIYNYSISSTQEHVLLNQPRQHYDL